MYLRTNSKMDCCGCTACMTVCNKNCITMVRDEYGFIFPQINHPNECVHCMRCDEVCPIERNKGLSPQDIYAKPICYYGWHMDNAIRFTSTSGAAFVGISQACKKNGYNKFYGARYNENMMVVHYGVNSIDDLSCLTSTKYVQSDMGNVYQQINIDLLKGDKVVFSGTPCQVEGLQNAVPQRLRNNLITISLICHGVSSPTAYKKYLNEISKKYKSEVKSVKFRDKRKDNGKISHTFTTINFTDGNVYSDIQNLYTLAYGMGLMHRDCCSNCPYTTPYRSADFTIGDFWGIEEFIPELAKEVSNGISMILIHTEKARELVPDIREKMILKEVLLEYAINTNKQPQLSKPLEKNKRREIFLKKVLIDNIKFEKIAAKEFRRWRYSNILKRFIRY